MSVFVRARTMVGGEEREVLVEVQRLDALQSGDGAATCLLDRFDVYAAPQLALKPVEPDDEEELMSAVETAIEGICR